VLGVGLQASSRGRRPARGAQVGVDLRQGRAAVDLRLARAEQVEVGAVQDQQLAIAKKAEGQTGTGTGSLAHGVPGVQTIPSQSQKFAGLMPTFE
jgi:hypothetical protein